jgi:LPXTG-motif cell wall-anchored protein
MIYLIIGLCILIIAGIVVIFIFKKKKKKNNIKEASNIEINVEKIDMKV